MLMPVVKCFGSSGPDSYTFPAGGSGGGVRRALTPCLSGE